MIFLGLPPTVANGTNRVAILLQSLGAVWGFNRHGVIEYRRLGPAVLPAILGSVLGTLLALQVGDVAFQKVLAFVMFGIAVFTVWDPVGRRYGGVGKALPEAGDDHPLGRWGLMLTFFFVGVYGGFIQVGVGFVLLAVTTAWGMDLVRGNALKVLVVLCFTPLALIIFASTGNVDWVAGLALAAGTFLGGLFGVRLNLRMGHAWLKKVVAGVVVLMAIRLLVSG
jgi:uncharacterized membrane protein YfcA